MDPDVEWSVQNSSLWAWISKCGLFTASFLLSTGLFSENSYSRPTHWCICFIHSRGTQDIASVSHDKWHVTACAESGPCFPTWTKNTDTSSRLMWQFLRGTIYAVRSGAFLRCTIACRNPQIFIKVCQLQLCVCICLCFLSNLWCTHSPHDCFYCMRFLLLGTSLLTTITTTSTENAPVLYN